MGNIICFIALYFTSIKKSFLFSYSESLFDRLYNKVIVLAPFFLPINDQISTPVAPLLVDYTFLGRF